MKLTPITELHPAACNLAQIIPDYASPERIGLNLGNLGRVAEWGGFRRDTIVIAGFDGERSSINTSVVGFGGDGTAVAGAASAKVADLGSGEPGNWSKHINTALAMGLREAAWKNLAAKPLPVSEARLSLIGTAITMTNHVLARVA